MPCLVWQQEELERAAEARRERERVLAERRERARRRRQRAGGFGLAAGTFSDASSSSEEEQEKGVVGFDDGQFTGAVLGVRGDAAAAMQVQVLQETQQGEESQHMKDLRDQVRTQDPACIL